MEPTPNYLLLGDRNMEGRAPGAGLPADYVGPHPNVRSWNVITSNLDAELAYLANNKSTSGFFGFGPELSFGTAIRNLNGGRPVTVQKTAVEQSSVFPLSGMFNDWAIQNYTNDLREAVDVKAGLVESGGFFDTLQSRGETTDLRGVVFSIGALESQNADGSVTVATMRAQTEAYIAYVREQAAANGLSRLPAWVPVPWVLILPPRDHIDTTAPNVDVVREALLEIAANDPHVHTVDGDGLEVGLSVQNTSDYIGVAPLELGDRAAELLGEYLAPLPFFAPVPTFLELESSAPDLDGKTDRYGGQALDLLPQGLLWNKRRDTNLRAVMEAFVREFARVDCRGRDLARESLPSSAVELLADWERVLGIPGGPDPLPGFYLDATDEGGDVRAFAGSPDWPNASDFPEIEFTLTAWVRVKWGRTGGANGWLDAVGAFSSAQHHLFRRFSSGTNRGLRILFQADHGNTTTLTGGAVAPALSVTVELGDSTGFLPFQIAADDVGALAGTFPIVEALGSTDEDGVSIAREWAMVSVTYRGKDGPAGASSGALQFFVNGQQIGPDLEVPPGDRMLEPDADEGITVAQDGSFDPWLGDVDQVRAYARVLPPDELAVLYNDGAGREIHGNEDAIVYGWEFDLEQGGVTPDAVGAYTGGDLTLGAEAAISTKPDYGPVLPDLVCPSALAATEILRRFEAAAKLSFQGSGAGQSEAFFVELAASLGFSVTVDGNEPFTPGSVAGDSITQGLWVFVWEVHAPEINPVFFSAGESGAGEPLVADDATPLVCGLEEHKPAHTLVFFRFDLDYTGHAPWSSTGPAAAGAVAVAPSVLATPL